MSTNIEVVVGVSGEAVAAALSSDYEKAFEMICMIDGEVAEWHFTQKVATHFVRMLKEGLLDDREYASWLGTI